MSRISSISSSIHLLTAISVRAIALIVFVVCLTPQILRAQSDTRPPQVLSLSINPPTVDVTAASQVVTFTVHATDNLSGVSSVLVISLVGPSGEQLYGFSQFQSDIILDGVFQIPVTVPRYAEPGTWTVALLLLQDNVG